MKVQMIQQRRAYYLIKGAVVQVILEDAAAGMSQIHSTEIGPDVWTLTGFLSKRPVRSPDGEIEVPGHLVALTDCKTADLAPGLAHFGAFPASKDTWSDTLSHVLSHLGVKTAWV